MWPGGHPITSLGVTVARVDPMPLSDWAGASRGAGVPLPTVSTCLVRSWSMAVRGSAVMAVQDVNCYSSPPTSQADATSSTGNGRTSPQFCSVLTSRYSAS